MYPLLNNLDTECIICFYNSIMNNSIFIVALTLFSIDSVYECGQGTYSFLFNFTCLFYLFIDVLMYTCIIMRDNFLVSIS